MAGPGYFITFEGPEGSGKSTQIERLAAELRKDGHSVITTREPGGTPMGEAIRALLLDRRATGMTPWTEALLFTASRAQLVRDIIRPRLAAGDIVISDRYADSTMAYQGCARRLDRDTLGRLQDVATGGLKPNLTLLLSLSVEVGLRRIAGQHRDRLDEEAITFHMAVHDAYQKFAAQEPNRWKEIDASRSADAVAFSVLEAVKEALANVNTRRSA